MEAFEIDLDSECVWLDDAWLNREDLVRKIRAMIDAGDYQLARPSQALETLTRSLAQARLLALRINPEMSDALNALAQQIGRPMGAVAREAIAAFLASAAGQGPQMAAQSAAPIGIDARAVLGAPSPIQLSAAVAAEAVIEDAMAVVAKAKEEPVELEKQWFDSKA